MKRNISKLIIIFCFIALTTSCNKNNDEQSMESVITYIPYFMTSESALCGGEFCLEDHWNYEEYGLCWALHSRPTIDDNSCPVSVNNYIDGYTWFTHQIDGLEPDNKYFVRAYVRDINGQTQYGGVKSFVTTTDDNKSYYRTFSVGDVTFKMVRIDVDGPFYMGAQSSDPAKPNYDPDALDFEAPVHRVILRNNYYIGETEVTRDLWQAVLGYNSCTNFENGMSNCNVSWNMITQEFLPKLNEITGMNFRLPTEAEWELAARGSNQGRHFKYAGSNDLEDVGWFIENSPDNPHAPAHFSPNERGLYDMSGNVAEICEDWTNYYSSEDQIDPIAQPYQQDLPYKIIRGGSYSYQENSCRVTSRGDTRIDERWRNVGFRLACDE